MSPTVSLVGAGPGDPELLTVRALKRIEAADVVLADDLIDPRVLALVKGRLLRVGKRGGCISTDQHFIHALMIREARAGHRVVRLKGGAPSSSAADMGVARAAGITAKLLAAGLKPDLPAAIVSAAHTAHQRHAVTTLTGLPDCIAREGLKSPALLVIGEVAAQADQARHLLASSMSRTA